MNNEYVYSMTKKQYQFYFTEEGGAMKSKKDLIRYINETYGLLGTCVDVVTED